MINLEIARHCFSTIRPRCSECPNKNNGLTSSELCRYGVANELITAYKQLQEENAELKEKQPKQTPRRPTYEGDGYGDDGELVYDIAYCPECNHSFEYEINDWGSNYCPDCGQALDWSEEQEADDEETR